LESDSKAPITKIQAPENKEAPSTKDPSTRETSSYKHQPPAFKLVLGFWCFSGAWSLDVGDSFSLELGCWILEFLWKLVVGVSSAVLTPALPLSTFAVGE
jgi:hypothetical protein